MNYLAHLCFAAPNQASRIGNLLGDFCQGLDLQHFPADILAGLAQHRAIDRFTDRSIEVQQAKLLFAPQRRRFAAVAVDMVFDHLLILHWDHFYPQPFADYKATLYQQLQQDLPQMPERMRHTVSAIITQDWFAAYAELDLLGKALDNIASRIRFANQFAGSIADIRQHYPALNQLFLQFYPRLQQFVLTLPEQLPVKTPA